MLPKIGKIVLECSVDGIEKGFLNEGLETVEQVKEALRADAALNDAYDKAGVRHSSCSAQALAQETFTGRVDSPLHFQKCPQCKHNAAAVAAIIEKNPGNKVLQFAKTNRFDDVMNLIRVEGIPNAAEILLDAAITLGRQYDAGSIYTMVASPLSEHGGGQATLRAKYTGESDDEKITVFYEAIPLAVSQ